MLWFLLAVCAADPLPLLGEEKWYRDAPEPERAFEGVLERNAAPARLGAGRYNAYRLAWIDGAGRPSGREIHLPGKAYLLADHVGRKVRLIGKAVDSPFDGAVYQELWPVRLEFLDTPEATAKPLTAVEGVYARCGWQPEAGLHPRPQLRVFRAPSGLIGPLRLSGNGAESAATELMARRLQVPTIDWNRYMLLTVSAGLAGRTAERLDVTRVVVRDQMLTVYYKLEPSAGGAIGLNFPAETVLVDRFDGELRLEAETKTRE